MYLKSTILIVCLGLPAAGCASHSSGVQSTTSPTNPQATTVTPSITSGTTASSPNTTASSPNTPAINDSITPGIRSACGFLEDSEVAAVQGAPVQSKTPNQQTTGGMVTSQCYYTVISADKAKNLSVHLQVVEADSKAPNAVNEYWKNAFHEKEKREREKKEGPPQAVAGLGEEAFWIDSGKTGVLYALHKRRLVRISVGGGVDSKDRLAKSKALIMKALGRIS